MPEITAQAVKDLRDRTGLPMMDCKRALQESGGDLEKSVELLRKEGKKTMEKRAGRATSTGRIAVYTDFAGGVGTMVDLRCESAPVANNDQFVQLANDLAKQLATGPGADSAGELLAQRSPSQPNHTLKQQFEDLNNRIREVFKLERLVRINGVCGGYAHHNGAVGVLLQVEGGNPELAKDICMHIAAMRPDGRGKGRPRSGGDRQGAGNPRRGRPRRGQAGEDHREDGRRPPAKLLRRALPPRTAVRQGRQADRGPGGQGRRA